MHVDGDQTKPERKPPTDLGLVSMPVQQVSEHHLLGITVDEQLEWKPHINNISKTVSRNTFSFKIKPNNQP